MIDDPVPRTVTILTPVQIERRYGKASTTMAGADVLTFRCPPDALDVINRAIAILDPQPSRGLFLCLCAQRIAEQIVAHHAEWEKETNGSATGTSGDTRQSNHADEQADSI